MLKNILYPDKFFEDDFLIEKKYLHRKYNLVGLKLGKSKLTNSDIDLLNNSSALVAGINFKIDKEIISMLDNCRIITRGGVGFDLIDIEECKKKIYLYVMSLTMELVR